MDKSNIIASNNKGLIIPELRSLIVTYLAVLDNKSWI